MSSPSRAGSAPGSSRPERAPDSSVTVSSLPGPVESRKSQPSLHKHHLFPHELFASITSTVGNKTAAGHTIHNQHCEACGIGRPDAVWHHQVGRQKYKYFLDQPTSLTGAGRDISFLCDALVAPKKTSTLPPLTEKTGATDTQKLSVSESLIPDEYRMVKNEGIRTLELYEDAFTVQLKDEEQKLRVLPSLKPSGRLEVVQLLRLMDDMLEKAGVDQETEELTEICQLEGLLQLVKVEQNIYNIVFHEVIRQVSVGCVERGQLLAKLRQRYQSLLDRIPHRLKALHTELVAQRSLNRRFTEEIHELKTYMQQLHMELTKIRQHDSFVLQQAELAHRQLAESLKQTDTNLHVVEGYHELYELQRARLETQVLQMTEDRDYRSHLTFCLALQVISIKKLDLFSQLHINEQNWNETAECCVLFIISEDIEDLQIITGFVDYWRKKLNDIMSKMKKHERALCAQIKTIQQDSNKFLSLDPTHELAKEKWLDAFIRPLKEIHCNLLKWSEALTLLCEHYKGEKQLWCQETLEEFASVQEKWVTFSFHLLKRHCSPDGDPPEGDETLKELDGILSERLKFVDKRLNGEDGIHDKITTMIRIIKAWIFRIGETISKVQKPFMWSNLEKALRECQRLSEEVLQHLSLSENNSDKNTPDIYSETEKLWGKVQEFKTYLCHFIEDEHQKIRDQIDSIHKGQTLWMLDVLLLMIADHNNEQTQKERPSYMGRFTVQTVDADTKILTEKLDRLSGYITSLCILALEKQDTLSQEKDKFDNLRRECRKLQVVCINWVETSKILLAGLNRPPVELFIEQTEVSPAADDLVDPADNTVAPVEEVVVPEQFELETEAEGTKDETEAEPEQKPAGEHESQKQQQGELSSCDSLVVKQIGYDTNVIERKLEESSVFLTGVDEQFVSPVTEYAQKAFSDLTSVALLQQELQDSEVRLKTAEQRALKAEEALYAALDKIQNMERQSSSQEPDSHKGREKSPLTSTSKAHP